MNRLTHLTKKEVAGLMKTQHNCIYVLILLPKPRKKWDFPPLVLFIH